jgi:hypothetical protein
LPDLLEHRKVRESALLRTAIGFRWYDASYLELAFEDALPSREDLLHTFLIRRASLSVGCRIICAGVAGCDGVIGLLVDVKEGVCVGKEGLSLRRRDGSISKYTRC